MAQATISDAPQFRIPPEWVGWVETHNPSWLVNFFWIVGPYWRTIVMTTVLGAAAGYGLVQLAGRQYTSTAQIELQTSARHVVHVDTVLTDPGADRGFIDGQIELMKSNSLARRLIRELGLFHAPAAPSPAVDTKSVPIPDENVEQFLSNLKVEREGLTYLINITFEGKDAKQAAAIANAIARGYIQQKQESVVEASREATQWLQSQIEQMREKVRLAEQSVLQYRAEHNLMQVGQVSLDEYEINEYTKNLITARTAMLRADASVRQLDQIGNDRAALRGLDAVMQSKQVADLQHQYTDLKNKQVDLKARFGANHPDVLNAQDQLQHLDAQIEAETQRVVDGIRQNYEVAKREVALLEDDYAKLKDKVSAHNLETLELGERQRNLEATRSLYVNFLSRLQETTAQETLPTEGARFVSEAIAPSRGVHPHALMTLIVAIAGGLTLGILWALLNAILKAMYVGGPANRAKEANRRGETFGSA